MFKNAKEGDRVWSTSNGWGIIRKISSDLISAIYVEFSRNKFLPFTFSGKLHATDLYPTLFWDEVKIIVPPTPKRKVKKIGSGWINIHKHITPSGWITFQVGGLYYSKDEAVEVGGNTTSCPPIYIQFEYEEEEVEMKYKLGESKVIDGVKMYRVIALKDIPRHGVKAGDVGGWIESEKNLSQDDDAWVGGDAKVSGKAKVSGSARISRNTQVSGNAQVYGDAQVYDNALVGINAKVYEKAKVSGRATVYKNAEVYGNAWVYGNAKVSGNGKVFGNAKVGEITIFEKVRS